MKTKKVLFYLMLVLCTYATSGFAQEAATEERKEEEPPKLTISGYIDSYYLHAFNNPKSGNLMGAEQGVATGLNGVYPVGRAFDRMTDQFSLGLVQTKFTYSDS